MWAFAITWYQSVVRRRKLSYLNLLLWNYWTKSFQTWRGWPLGGDRGSLSQLCPKPRPPFKMYAVTKIELSLIAHCCFIIVHTRSHLNLLLWNCKIFGRDGLYMTPFQNCVRQPWPPFKMAAVTKNINFFNCSLLLYYK